MSKFVLFLAGLFFVNVASAAVAISCSQEMEGKQSCISGESMKCVKKFDPNTKAFKFELQGVTAQGNSIDVNSTMYKKTAGYTPAVCSDSKISQK